MPCAAPFQLEVQLLSFVRSPSFQYSLTMLGLVYNKNVCCRTQVEYLDQFDEPYLHT